MVLTSHDRLGNTGRKTGFWLEEFAAPYYTFKDAGAEIVLASPKGGQPPLDPKSNEPNFQTDLTHRFEADADAKAQLATTLRLDSVKAEDFDTVFYPGGHGPHQPAGSAGVGPLVSFARSGLNVRWAPAFQSLLELAEACDVPVRWACRTGVCHSCETGLIIGAVGYRPEPVEPPADGNALICCCRPQGDIVIDL
jgi:ferredoxin